MKKVFSIGMMLVIMLSLVSVASADSPAPGGPFTTAFRVQNLGTSSASCTYSFYNATGTAAFTTAAPVTVLPGDSMYVYTGDPSFTTLSSGNYSGVVSCDQPVAAVVNFSDTNSGASHSGVAAEDLASTWYAPGIYNNFFSYYSNIVVQNATSAPINITVDIFQAGVVAPVRTTTQSNVAANASVSFEQEGAPELLQDVAYSAKISATGNIAPIVNIYGLGAVDQQLYSYNPFAAGSTTAYAPVIMNAFYGYNTSLTVQNIGAADANVTVEYGTGQTQNFVIPSNAAQQIYTPATAVPVGSLTGAKVTSTNSQPIVLLVNESNASNRAASYSGFAAGSTEVRAPIVLKRYFAYNSSVTCQNVGASATTMTLTYAGNATPSSSGNIAAGGTFLFYQPTEPQLPDNFIGSATITASQPIVCVVNQDFNEPPLDVSIQDQLYAYNGINP